MITHEQPALCADWESDQGAKMWHARLGREPGYLGSYIICQRIALRSRWRAASDFVGPPGESTPNLIII